MAIWDANNPTRNQLPRLRIEVCARAGEQTLRTHNIGALPIANPLLERMQLERFFESTPAARQSPDGRADRALLAAATAKHPPVA